MTDRRKLIGNEIRAGGQQLRPALKIRREQLIRFAANPPLLPVPTQVESVVPENPMFTQVAYSLLLIAALAAIAAGTSYINWAFLAYGILAVAARLPSNQMFIAALICLVFIPLTTILQRGTLANDFAVMTFYFLLIGLVRAVLELRRESKPAKKQRK